MAERGPRAGAANTAGLVLAIVAVLSVGGLIVWLDRTAEPTEVEYEAEDVEETEAPESDVPIVELEQVRTEMADYEALEIEMRDYSINSLLGEEAFFIGSEDNPFLVKMDAEAVEETGEVSTEESVNLRGTIRAMSDSVLDAWEEAGAIEGEGERAVAQFAEYFLEANQVDVLDEDGGDDGDEGDGDDGAGGDE